jgi:hypothetical protein
MQSRLPLVNKRGMSVVGIPTDLAMSEMVAFLTIQLLSRGLHTGKTSQ